MIIRILLIAYILVLFQPSITAGYDDQITHPEITGKAVSDVSNLNAYLKTSLGFSKGLDTHLPSDSTDPNKTILKLLTTGSTAEDSPACRASNHFHDPLKAWGESRMSDDTTGAAYLIRQKCNFDGWSYSNRQSDITWATGYLSSPPGGQKQTFTTNPDYAPINWDKARDSYYKALTSTTNLQPPSTPGRDYYFANAFQSLGNVLHLLQDMAVPAHVRNDFTSHIAFNGKTSSEFVRWFGNPYEYYVQTHTNTVTGIADSAIKYPSFTNTRITDFWDADQYIGNNPSSGLNIGLAEFTNANYLSDSTIPYTIRMPYHMYTYPKIDDPNIQICKDYEPGSTKKRVYLSRKDRGACPPITEARSADHFAALGFWNDFSVNTIINAVLNLDLTVLATPISLDDNVHKTYANDILPRAVGYSAGLLDYFFRGSIDITVPSNGVYSMVDATQPGFDPATAAFTSIKLFVKNNTLTGEEMTDGSIDLVIKYRLPNGDPFDPGDLTVGDHIYKVFPEIHDRRTIPRNSSVELAFDLSGNPLPLNAVGITFQIVYHGALGNETDAVAVGMKYTSDPTPLDIFNNMDKVCINGQWYDAGSPSAIAVVDANGDGIAYGANESDVYPHELRNLHARFSSISNPQYASPTNFNTGPLTIAPGGFQRAMYFLSDESSNSGDYKFAYSFMTEWAGTYPSDNWFHLNILYLYGGIAIPYFEETLMCGDQPCTVRLAPSYYPFRGRFIWWGSSAIYENPKYPVNTSCSWNDL